MKVVLGTKSWSGREPFDKLEVPLVLLSRLQC